MQFSILFWSIPRSTEKILDSFLETNWFWNSTHLGISTAKKEGLPDRNLFIINVLMYTTQWRIQEFTNRGARSRCGIIFEVWSPFTPSHIPYARIIYIFLKSHVDYNRVYAVKIFKYEPLKNFKRGGGGAWWAGAGSAFHSLFTELGFQYCHVKLYSVRYHITLEVGKLCLLSSEKFRPADNFQFFMLCRAL